MKRIVVAALVLVAALAAWMLWPRADLPAEGGEAATPEQPVENGTPADALTTEDVAAALPAKPLESVERSAVEAPAPEPEKDQENAEPVRVLVVEKGSLRPMAAVEVLWLRDIDYQLLPPAAKAELKNLGQEPEVGARRFGRVARTDVRGETLLPRPKQWALAVAREGNLYGDSGWSAGRSAHEPLRVEMEPDRTMRVEVRDERERPQSGVTVVLQAHFDEGHAEQLASDESNAQGIVLLAHLQKLTRSWQQAGAKVPASVAVALRIPGLQDPGTNVDLASPPATIRLHMPATGKLVAIVQDHRGRTPAQTGSLSLWCLPLPEKNEERWDRTFRHSFGPDQPRAVFEHVALGQRVHLEAEVAGVRLDPREVAGPSRAGEEVVVTLAMDQTQPVLSARVLDAAAKPFAEHSLFVRARMERGSVMQEVKTDADGRFELPIDKHYLGRKLHRVDLDLEDKVGRLLGRFAKEREVQPGLLDLGEIVLDQGPLVVSGTTVDDLGQPVRADVRVAERAAPRADHPGELRLQRDLGSQEEIVTRYLDGGRFEMRGRSARSGELVLSARRRGFQPFTPLPFMAGTPDVKVVLHRGGALAALVLHDEAVKQRDLAAELVGPQGPVPRPAHSRSERTLTTFGWEGLVPGSYRLTLRMLGLPEPILVLDNLEVRAGEPCGDPRLQQIDLRTQIALLTVRLTAADGKKIGNGAVLVASEGIVQQHGFAVRDGVAKVPFAGAPLDLEIRVPSYRFLRLRNVMRDVDVKLEPRLSLRLHLDGMDSKLPDGVNLRITLRPPPDALPADLELRSDKGEYGTLPARQLLGWLSSTRRTGDGDVVLQVPMPGEYSLAASLESKDRKRRVPVSLDPATIVVMESPQPQRFTTHVDQAWRAALEQVKQ